MTRLKVHHMSEGGTSQAAISEKCGVGLRSVERILKEPAPTTEEVVANMRATTKRVGRAPKADPSMVERIRMLLDVERDLPAIEVWSGRRTSRFATARSWWMPRIESTS